MPAVLRHPGLTCSAALLALLAAEAVERYRWGPSSVADTARAIVRTAQNRDVNREAREALTGGYYEGLLNEGARVSSMNALVTGARAPEWTGTSRPGRRHRADFLYYDYLPHLNQPEYDDPDLRLVTNSHGLADQEYTLHKPPGVRRLAVLGDSLVRGQGAPFGTSFEALLEDRLNAAHRDRGVERYELLNFAVSGYRITQTLDVALERAPLFEPDVYMLALSDLSVFRRWGHHLAQLVYDGIDLKYPYLQQLVRQAQLTPGDAIGTMDAKLARHRLPTLAWILREVRDHAHRQHAGLVVILVPTVTDPDALREDFMGVREILADLGVPVLDLLDTFRGVEGLNAYRVSESNRHPNERGHRLLFESLYRELLANPAAWSHVRGDTAR